MRHVNRAIWFERDRGWFGWFDRRQLLQTGVGGIEPADDRFEAEELGTRGAKPVGELVSAVQGDPEALLRSLALRPGAAGL